MKSQKLKTLFIVMAAVLAVTGVDYVAGHNIQTVYASEKNDQNEEGKVDIKVIYNNENSSNSIDPVITITNTYDKELNLKDLNLQYYYQSNGETDEVFACYYAGTVDGEYKNLSNNVEGKIKKSDDGRYADITFNGGSLEKGQSMSIQASVHKTDWTNYDAIDKSLCRTNAYIDGKLVYGDDKKEEKVQDSKLLTDSIDYTPESDEDVDINVQLNGNKLSGITDISSENRYGTNEDNFDLKEGKDYTVKYDDSGEVCVVTLKKNYLISGDSNDYKVLKFNFSKGNSQNLNISYVFPERPYGYMMGIGSKEVNYTDSIEVPLYVNSLDYYKGLYSCEAEIKYDPDQVRVSYVFPEELIDKSENFKYEDDIESGILKITYQADSLIDSSALGVEASICDIIFEGRNGEMGSESSLEVSGTASAIDNPDYKTEINNIHSGKIVFKGKEDVDLSMPVLETNCMYVMDDEQVISLKINENGNKFLGIEGLEEGTDYVYKNNILTIKNDSIQKCRYFYSQYDIFLNFENNIRKVFTVVYDSEYIEGFTADMEGAQGKAGDLVKVPVIIGHDGNGTLSHCAFNLKYDPDMFEDAFIEYYNENNETGKLYWNTDRKTGTVNVYYYDIDDRVLPHIGKQPQLDINLVLKVKDNGFIGDTRIGFESNEFTSEHCPYYPVYFQNSRLVTIEK